jgi:ketosteroid isomerase-like protein
LRSANETSSYRGTRITDNVELVRRAYQPGPIFLPSSPDDERAIVDRLFGELCDEQLEVRMPPEYPEGEQVLRGRTGMRRLFAMLRDTWTEFRFEPERFIDCGERVAVLVRVLAKGGASGVETERRTAHVWTVRDGRLTSIRIYRDRAEALEAIGVQD